MIARPHTSSAIHHHGEQGWPFSSQPHYLSPLSHRQSLRHSLILSRSQPSFSLPDTIIYAASGHGTIVTNPSLRDSSDVSQLTCYDLAPGDFALIPAWTEHQEVNESDEDVVWIVTRSGSSPVVVNLEGWGRGRKKA
jgi:hypothetical protein